MQKKQTFWSLQAGRGIAALCVVMHHCSAYFGNDPRFWRHSSYATLFSFGALGVNFFFVLSGIVIFLAHRRDLGHPERLIPFIRKRFFRVYPIYWVVLAVVAGTFTLFPAMNHGNRDSGWVLLSSVLLVHIHSVSSTLGVAWSLFSEIMFYAVFGLAILHFRLGMAVLASWFALCGFQIAHSFPGHPVLGLDASPWHLLFGLGMLVAIATAHPKAGKLPVNTILGIGCVLMIAACVWCDLRGPKVVPVYLFGGVASAVFLLGIMLAEKGGRVSVPMSLRILGDASYAIYLIHFPVLSAITGPVFRLSHRLPFVPLPAWFMLEAAVAVTIGLLLHWHVERYLLKLPAYLNRKSSSTGDMLGLNSATENTSTAG